MQLLKRKETYLKFMEFKKYFMELLILILIQSSSNKTHFTIWHTNN